MTQLLALGLSPKELADFLREKGLVSGSGAKPSDPKKAFEAALRHARKRRSPALYRAIAERASLKTAGCRSDSFRQLVAVLRAWFPPVS